VQRPAIMDDLHNNTSVIPSPGGRVDFAKQKTGEERRQN
jgi:hypothetical protein